MKKILLAFKDGITIELVKKSIGCFEQFREKDIEFSLVKNEEDFKKALQKEKFDLVITGANWIKTLGIIESLKYGFWGRKGDLNQATPFVAYTSLARPESLPECIIRDWLRKPVSLDEFTEILKKYL